MPDQDFTDDALLGGRVRIRQPKAGYRAAIDPVLLAAFLRAPLRTVLDAGCGSGAAMFCAAARLPDSHFTGLELQPEIVALATQGIALNQIGAHASVVVGDLFDAQAAPGPFDAVITNPPYTAEGTPPPNAARAAAHMETAGIAAWIDACLARLKPHGRFVMIHRADRLSEIMAALGARVGDVRLLPVHPRAGEPARRVLIDAGKGRRSPDTLLPGLVLHEADGRFTPAADAVLRDAAPLG
jgi:tRNA1(Val) A37 N6-methylase TrmN6